MARKYVKKASRKSSYKAKKHVKKSMKKSMKKKKSKTKKRNKKKRRGGSLPLAPAYDDPLLGKKDDDNEELPPRDAKLSLDDSKTTNTALDDAAKTAKTALNDAANSFLNIFNIFNNT